MGQCEDDIKIPFPMVQSILIGRECIQLYILIGWEANQSQIDADEVQLKCEDDIRNYSI